VFDRQKMNEICKELGEKEKSNAIFFSPYQSMFGNYDISVLILALDQQGYELNWWNKKAGIE
jgi:hypothetical protein